MENNSTHPNQQPQNPIPPVNLSGNSKIVPIGLGVIVVLVIAIGAYVLGTKQSQPIVQNAISPTPLPTKASAKVGVDETAGWKTYGNTKYDFELNYPPDWVFKEEKRQDQPSTLLTIGFSPEFTSDKPRPIDYINNASVVSISIQENSKSLEEIIKIGSCHAGPESCTPYENVIDLVVAGLPAKKVSPPDILPTNRVFLKQNGRLYFFRVTLDESFVKSHSLTVGDKRKIFDQILSTFRFSN